LHPAVPIVFKFYDSWPPSINRAWIQTRERAANSPADLHIADEPTATSKEDHP
jgi:hypothetical protein